MELKAYLSPLSHEARTDLAKRCDTSVGHLVNVANGKTCGWKLAAALERESGGEVTRRDMRPLDYWHVWIDLAPPKPTRGSRPKEARA